MPGSLARAAIDFLKSPVRSRQVAGARLRRGDSGRALKKMAGGPRGAGGTAARASETAGSAKRTATQAATAPAPAPAALPVDANAPASQNAFNPSIGVVLDGRFASIG